VGDFLEIFLLPDKWTDKHIISGWDVLSGIFTIFVDRPI